MRPSRRHLPAVLALAFALGCASGESARKELDALRAEVRALRQENEALSRKVDSLGGRVEAMAARSRQAEPAAARPPGATPTAAAARAGDAIAIPEGLAVVKVEPAKGSQPKSPPKVAPRRGTPPPVATAIPIVEPDPERVEAIGRPAGGLGAQADAELKKARAESGDDRAHALEDFSARYPRHPSADNALVEAAAAYAEAGKDDAACALARRATEGYPAGDAMSDGLERLAWCERRRGAPGPERQLLERLVSEYPRTPAAQRAAVRLSALAGEGASTAPAPVPAPQRSSP